MVNLKELLESAPKIVERRPFGSGDGEFEVELQLIARPDLEEMRRTCIKQVAVRGLNGREKRDELDIEKLREYMADTIITGWTGLTLAKAMHACNRKAPAGAKLDERVEFTRENALALLKTARGDINGDLVSFDDWVWASAMSLSEEKTQTEVREKNV